MKIRETVERDCCKAQDLKPVDGTPMRECNRIPEYKFCVHCGAHWGYTTFMDAAGSRDWEYRKTLPPWERPHDL